MASGPAYTLAPEVAEAPGAEEAAQPRAPSLRKGRVAVALGLALAGAAATAAWSRRESTARASPAGLWAATGLNEEALLTDTNTACVGCVARHAGVPVARLPRGAAPGQYAVKVMWLGQEVTKYFPNAEIVENGRGAILVSDAEKGFNMVDSMDALANGPPNYTKIPLVGNSLSVTIDMGNPAPSCGCNAAFFLISMPSTKTNDWGGYYCDANCVGGNCCAEFDLLEMNGHVLLSTSHSCSDYQTPPFDSYTWACDHIGSPQSFFGNGKMDFGPGPGYAIDSQKPFRFKMDFPIEGGVLKAITTLTQGERQEIVAMDNIDGMRGPLTDGMVLALDSWEAADIGWLDGGVCTAPEQCNRRPVKFTDIVLESLESER